MFDLSESGGTEVMDSKQILLQMKYARLIEGIAERQGIPIEDAMDRFYHSKTHNWDMKP